MMSEATRALVKEQVNQEEAATVVEMPVKEVKPEPVKKARTIEELDNAGVRGMSETEKVKYINYLREERQGLQSKIGCLEQQIRSALAGRNEAEGRLEAIRKDANTKVSYLVKQINNLKETIDMIFEGGR